MRQKAIVFALGFAVGGGLLFTIALVSAPDDEESEAQSTTAARFAASTRDVVAEPSDSMDGYAVLDEQRTRMLGDVVPAVVRVLTRSTAGSGVVIDAAGMVLTSGHLVRDGETATVLIGDGEPVLGTVIRLDTEADLALIRLPPGQYAWAELGSEEDIVLGSPVYSIGYPLDMGGDATVTKGIVSRYFDGPSGQEKFVQTDAAITLGNSGGPIVNEQGMIIGIVSLIAGSEWSKVYPGISFAVSVATIRDRFVDQ